METNDYQIGGNHYVKEYQHWDFVCDTGMHYLLGCFTKYITRWRKKNGLEDITKSLHYLAKAEDKDIKFPITESYLVDRYIRDMEPEEAGVIVSLCLNDFEDVRNRVAHLIAEEQERLDQEGEATSDYVNQD